MIYCIYGKTIHEFMQKVNDAVRKGHRVVVMDRTRGFSSYTAKMDTEPPKGPKLHWQR